jgi:hypothetical protein
MVIDDRATRAPIVAGIFYPEEPDALARAASDLLKGEKGMARAVIVPHAAWDYAGTLIGLGLRACAAREPKLAVILAPSHRDAEYACALPESESFVLPGTELPVRRDLVAALPSYSTLFELNDIAHLEEHSIEIILPVLKAVNPGMAILPLLVGKIGAKQAAGIGKALAACLAEEDALYVVSSNLSYAPNAEASAEHASRFVDALTTGDFEGLSRAASDATISACGARCVMAVWAALGGKGSWELLGRGDSLSHRASDRELAVHYGALVLR